MKLFKVIANEDQLKIIQDALENYTRLGIGQLEVVLSDLGFKTYEQFKDNIQELHKDETKQAIKTLKFKLFKKSFGASHSIHSSEVHENFKVAYDLYSTIQDKLSSGKGNIEINSSSPNKISKNGIIKIELIETEQKEGPWNASRKKIKSKK
jgi:hypothetical protein